MRCGRPVPGAAFHPGDGRLLSGRLHREGGERVGDHVAALHHLRLHNHQPLAVFRAGLGDVRCCRPRAGPLHRGCWRSRGASQQQPPRGRVGARLRAGTGPHLGWLVPCSRWGQARLTGHPPVRQRAGESAMDTPIGRRPGIRVRLVAMSVALAFAFAFDRRRTTSARGVLRSRMGVTAEVGRDMSAGELVDVRAGQHACFDRLVMDVADARLTGWSVRYVDRVRQDGGGQLVPVRGGARLEVNARVSLRDPGPPIPSSRASTIRSSSRATGRSDRRHGPGASRASAESDSGCEPACPSAPSSCPARPRRAADVRGAGVGDVASHRRDTPRCSSVRSAPTCSCTRTRCPFPSPG